MTSKAETLITAMGSVFFRVTETESAFERRNVLRFFVGDELQLTYSDQDIQDAVDAYKAAMEYRSYLKRRIAGLLERTRYDRSDITEILMAEEDSWNHDFYRTFVNETADDVEYFKSEAFEDMQEAKDLAETLGLPWIYDDWYQGDKVHG